MKGVLLVSSLMIAAWASLLALLYLVEVVVFGSIAVSWLRSAIGLLLYAAWAGGWYAIMMKVAKRLVVKAEK